MCTIMLSINPEYSIKILQGTKKYEFRRQIAKQKVDRILIYSTAPEIKVVGSVKVKNVISDSPENLWEKTKHYSGICKEKYFKYFENKELAYAYELGDVECFNIPKKLDEYKIKAAPQSFIYISIK